MPAKDISDSIYGPCVSRMVAASGGEMSADEAKSLLKELDLVKNQVKATLGRTEGAGLRDAVSQALEQHLEESKIAKLQAQHGIVYSQGARQGKLATVQKLGKTAKQQIKAFKGILAQTWDERIGNRLGDGLKMQYAKFKASQDFNAALTKNGVAEQYANRSLETEWARELQQLNSKDGSPGITGNKDAQKIAQVIHDQVGKIAASERRVGLYTPELDGYVSKQTYDPVKMRAAGEDAFRAKFLQHIDADRVYAGMTPEEIQESVHNTYNNFLTGRHEDYTTDSNGVNNSSLKPVGTNLQAKASAQRQFHFKSIEDHMAFNKEFGTSDYTEQINSTLQQRASRAALVGEWGLNAEENMNWVLDKIKEQAHSEGDKKTMDVIDNKGLKLSTPKMYIDEMLGRTQTPRQKPWWVQFQQWAMKARNVSSLGSASISAQSDIANAANHIDTLFGNGAFRNFAGIEPAYLAAMAAGLSDDAKHVQTLTSLTGDTFKQSLIHGRFGMEDTSGLMQKADNIFFKLNLLHRHDNAVTAVAAAMSAKLLGNFADTAHADLPAQLQAGLKRYDIGKSEWDALRKGAWEGKDGNYIAPNSTDALKNEDVEHLLKENQQPTQSNFDGVRDSLNQKLGLLFLDLANHTVPSAGLRERVHLYQGTSPDSLWGGLLHLAGQFKAFPVGMVTKNLARDIYGNPGSGITNAGLTTGAHVASVVVMHAMMLAIAGAAVYGIKNTISGKTTPMPTSPRQAFNLGVHSISSGGGFGFLGDALLPSNDETDKGADWMHLAAGPVLGDVAQVGEAGLQSVYGGATGRKEALKSMTQLGLNYVPFSNHFATKYLFNFGVRYPLMESLSPGYTQRMQQRTEKNDGSSFFLPPAMKGSQ